MKISQPQLAEIHQHLEQGYPNEACGVMLGTGDTVTEVVAASNQRDDSAHNRYLIDPLAYLKIEREADRRGIAVLGSYAYCLTNHPGPNGDFWGGVPDALRPVYTVNMFLAAAGYLAFTFFLMFRWQPAARGGTAPADPAPTMGI